MMRLLRAHVRAGDLDLPDLIDFMLGTGVRIGEALAVRRGTNADGEPLLDLDTTPSRSTRRSSASRAKA